MKIKSIIKLILDKLIMGALSLALGAFAIREIITATDTTVIIIAFLLLVMAIAGFAESLRTVYR